MKKIILIISCLMMLDAAMPGFAYDSFKEIEKYDPETDPQVNFPQKIIDEATGVSGENTGETVQERPTEPAAGENAAGTEEGAPTVTPAAEGTPAAKLVKAAAELYKKYAKPGFFPYLPETNNGDKGCAQVVNQIFEDAGIPFFAGAKKGSNEYYNRIRVLATYKALLEQGWVEVPPPPYRPACGLRLAK